MNIFQMGSIRKLRLAMDWTFDENSDWHSAAGQPARCLSGLRELWLSINHFPTTEFGEAYRQLSLRQVLATKHFTITLMGLAMLPLNRVEVVFSSQDLCEYTGSPSRPSWGRPAWDKQEREDYAQILRAMLLSPKGADLLREENDKHRLHELRDR